MALLEKQILSGFYGFGLIVSMVFILSHGFNTYVLCHLYFILIVPLLYLIAAAFEKRVVIRFEDIDA